MAPDFAEAAAGQQGDNGSSGEAVFLRELRACEGRAYHAHQRMADEFCRYASISVKIFFKGKDAQRFCKTAAHDAHAPGTPGPKLWADVVDILDAERFQFARQAQ